MVMKFIKIAVLIFTLLFIGFSTLKFYKSESGISQFPAESSEPMK